MISFPPHFLAKIGPESGEDVIRFSDGVNIGKCTPWIGLVDKNGYGKIGVNYRHWRAHRFMWSLHHSDPGGFHVLHHCDNPRCVRIEHLWIGTNRDNQLDMMAKGRQAKGEKNGRHTHPEATLRGDTHPYRIDPSLHARGERVNTAKLTKDQVREVRRLYSSGGTSQCELAKRFGITQPRISLIILRKTWKHVA